VAIADSPSLVRDDFREAVRLRPAEPGVGAHLYRMAEVEATGEAGKSANGASRVCERHGQTDRPVAAR
jgi:hypothetical protein